MKLVPVPLTPSEYYAGQVPVPLTRLWTLWF